MTRRRLVDDENIHPSFYALQRARRAKKASSGLYLYDGKQYTREELYDAVCAEARELPPDQWFGGRLTFEEWLADSVATGHVEKINYDL